MIIRKIFTILIIISICINFIGCDNKPNNNQLTNETTNKQHLKRRNYIGRINFLEAAFNTGDTYKEHKNKSLFYKKVNRKIYKLKRYSLNKRAKLTPFNKYEIAKKQKGYKKAYETPLFGGLGKDKYFDGYYLYNSLSPYLIKNKIKSYTYMTCNYYDCYLVIDGTNIKSVVFDNKGTIVVKGTKINLNELNIILNKPSTRHFEEVIIKGKQINKIYLEKIDKGYVLSSDNFKNIKILYNDNKISENMSHKKLITKSNRVLIYKNKNKKINIKKY